MTRKSNFCNREQVVGEKPKPARRPTGALSIGSRPADPGRELFSQIAEASGGEVFEWTSQPDLHAAIEGVLSDLRSQYAAAYVPPARDKTGFRRVKVRVKRPNTTATRTREDHFFTR